MTDMAKAFSAFPNQGVTKDLVSVLKVVDRNGQTVYKYEDSNFKQNIRKALDYPNFLLIKGKRVIKNSTAYLISHILLDNGARSEAFGSSSFLVVPKHAAVSVKTGTTDDLKDNWTIGYTPNFLSLVWVGNNDSQPMNPYLTSGITGAAPIWNKVMQAVLKNQLDLWPKKPEDIVGQEVCGDTGLNPQIGGDGQKNCSVRYEFMTKDSKAKGASVEKRKVFIDKATGRLASPGQTDNVEEQEKTIITDAFSSYCVDCSHENEPPTTVVVK
jgi:membrane carboxypeptidase/penicillin-binding protein